MKLRQRAKKQKLIKYLSKSIKIIMGNSNDNGSFLQKGEGLRILSIKVNSPFDGKVEPFFDFIVDIIPLAEA